MSGTAEHRASADEATHALAERVKELTALHAAAILLQDDDLSLPDTLGQIAASIPPALRFPEVAAARASFGDTVVSTPGFAETPWMLVSQFTGTEGLVGRIEIAYLEERAPGPDGPFLVEERRLLDSLVRMLECAVNHRHAQSTLRWAEAQLHEAVELTAAERDRSRMLLDITSVAASHLDLPELVSAVSRVLATTVPHHFASVTLWDDDAHTLRRHALIFRQGSGRLQDNALLPADQPTPARLAFDRGETMVFGPREIEALGAHSYGVMSAEGLASACCIPLRTRRGIIGTLNFASPLPDTFDRDDVRLLEQIAGQLAIAIDNALAYRQISALKDRLNAEKLYLEDEVTSHHEFRDIVGNSRALTEVLRQIRTVATTDATVLLLGETGTGKELLARAVHEASLRRNQPFVRVNGAALPANLVESELFGYERGAFTGAVASKVGRFELANKGTLFLDEIGEVPLDVQPKLLRALQEQELEHLGGTRTIHVDVRVIAATNRNLDDMVAAGQFRSDLYYRLNVFPIVVPPLRERPEDIPALVKYFAQKYGRELGRPITAIAAATMHTLEGWRWPGNIRELQNVIERAVILSTGGELRLPEGALQWPERSGGRAGQPRATVRDSGALHDTERDAIVNALREAHGVIGGPTGAAARLGLKRTTLQSKMRKLGIVRPPY